MKETEVEEFLRPIVESLNVELACVKFKGSKDLCLTVFIDSENGIDLNACELVHKTIDEPLDTLDPTFGASYTLNVSSLGLDWAFKTKRDYEKNIGKQVEFKLYSPQMGKKNFEGVLLMHDGESISVDCGGETLKFQVSQIAKITKLIKLN